MKFNTLLIKFYILILFLKIVYTQDFTVLSPNGGEVWLIGGSHSITYNSTCTCPNLRIIILENDNFVCEATHHPNSCSSNTGSTSWNGDGYACYVSPGENYKIRVLNCYSGSQNDESVGYFTLTDAGITTVSSTATDGNYTTGEVIPITVNFSVAVVVTGTPKLTLETGNPDAVANYASGSGTTTLTFNYTVENGNTSADLGYTSTSALSVNDGTIENTSGISAALTLPELGSSNSLSNNKDIVIIMPTIPVTISSTAASPTQVSPIPIAVSFGESVTGFTGGDIVVSGGTVTNFWGLGANYTFDFVPSGVGLKTVDIPGSIATSSAGYPNSAADQFAIIYDTTPSAPGGLTVSRETAGSALTLNWSQNSEGDVTKYRIFMETSSGPTTLIDSTLGVSDITKTISSLNNGTDYYFRIAAVDSFGFVSSYSSEVSKSPAELIWADPFDDLYNWTNNGDYQWVIENESGNNFASVSPPVVYNTYAKLSKTVSFNHAVELSFLSKSTYWVYSSTYYKLLIDGVEIFNLREKQYWENFSTNLDAGSHNIEFRSGYGFMANIDEVEMWKTYAPQPAIGSMFSSLTNSSTIPITVTFSESVTGFEEGDILVANGIINNFTGSGTDYSFNIEPSDDGLVTVDVPADIAVGTSGQNNMAAAQFSITYDGTNPTVTITSNESSPTDNTPIQTAVNFSESVTGFELSDITVTNGTASNFSGSGASYSFDLSPSTNGYILVDIASSKVQDSAGNPNGAADQFSILYDSNLFIDHFDNLSGWTNTTNSTNSNELWYISGSGGYIGNGARSNVGGYGYGDQLSRSFTFSSEVIVKLWVKKQAGDAVRIYFKVNGEEYWKFGDIGDPGSIWVEKEITIPEGAHTISIETDFAGYAWIDELEIGTNFSPVPVITSSYSSPTSNSPIPVDVNFSKAVTGFEQGDVSIVNGSAGNFIGSGASYSFNITPSSDGTVTVDIAEDVAQDDENNGNIAAQQFNIVYDSIQPAVTLSSSSASPTNTSLFPVEIVFSEAVSNFVPEIISIVNGAISAFSGSDLIYNINVAASADGNVKISIPENSVYDLAGNSNIEGNMLEIYYDNLPPDVDVDDIISAGTQDVLTIQWQSTDVSAIDSHNIYLTNDGQNYSLLSSVAGNVFSYDWTVPNILYDQNKIAVEAADEWGLVSSDTTNVFSILDNDPPLVSVIEPAESYSILEYDDLNIKWTASDNIGLDSMWVFYSNDGGNNFLHMGSVMADLNEFTFEVPFGVTDSGQIKLAALDIYNNEGEAVSEYFSVTDNTPPTVEITSPMSGNTFTIGKSENITWSEEDNVGITDREFAWSVDGVSWTDFSPDLIDGSSLWFIIPNQPTVNFMVRVIVSDAVALSDISVASGIHLVIEYPTLLSYTGSDSTFLSLQQGNDILVEFSVAMDSASIINISLSSMVFGDINYTVSEISSSIYNLNVYQQMASLDTLTLTIPASLQSSYEYGFDGNGDGSPGDSKEIDIYTETLADFDHNGSIDFTDLTTFITAWYADNYSKELGPFTGDTPHLIPAFDNAFDIEDIVAFMFMWNWSDDFSPSNMARMDEIGVPPTFIIENDILSLNLSEYEENIAAVHLQLNTFQLAINVISQGFEPGFDISLPRRWEKENIYEWNFGNPQGKNIETVNICRFETTLSHNQNMLIDYEIVSSNGATLSSGSTMVEYIPIPDDFALSRAYPNPFNPVTQIQYALPEDIHVELTIYDIMGRQVTELVSTVQQAGYYKVLWNGNNNASGLYFVTMSAGDFISTQKLMLVK